MTMQSYKLRSTRAMLQYLCNALWHCEDTGPDNVHRRMCAMSGRMLTELARVGISAGELMEQSRQTLAWTSLLSRPEYFAMYRNALALAKPRLPSNGGGPRPEIHFLPLSALFRLTTRHDSALLQLPVEMIAFGEDGFDRLAELIWHKRGRVAVATELVSPKCNRVREEMQKLTGGQAAGSAPDVLAKSFGRVNAEYFGGQMSRPALVWSRRENRRRFGTYDHLRDRVTVNALLARPDVPTYVLDFIMYHELLHRKQGIKSNGSRFVIHSPEFQADERRFSHYAQATAELERLARGRGRESSPTARTTPIAPIRSGRCHRPRVRRRRGV